MISPSGTVSPRSCVVRKIAVFDKLDMERRLYAGAETRHADFRLIESLDWPANETFFDVACDDRYLYVGVMAPQAASGGRDTPENADAVEVLFDPFHDHLGLLQYGADSLGGTYENTHWPYRNFDKNRHLSASWKVDLEIGRAHEAPDVVRLFFFRFDMAVFRGRDCVGFNVCRWQGAIQEASAWNRVSGFGFPDPDCLGHLWFTEPPGEKPEVRTEFSKSRRPPLRLYGTYDWPDHVWNVPYSPRDLENEMRWYRERGLERVYWLDYDSYEHQVAAAAEGRSRNLRKAIELFGTSDFLPQAARAAHNAGLEFVTLFKPLDLLLGDAFRESHPDYTMRRHPAWMNPPHWPITTLRVFQHDDTPFPFIPAQVSVWTGSDRASYKQVRDPLTIREMVLDRPEFLWSPAGKVAGPAKRTVRCLEISGLQVSTPWIAVEFTGCNPAVPLRNRQYLLAELVDSAGHEIFWSLCAHEGADSETGWWRTRTWPPHDASWARLDGGMDHLVSARAREIALEFSLDVPLHHETILDPCFPEVRRYWLSKMQRGLDAGADGVGVRIAHHIGCNDWLAYAFAAPMLEEFRKRRGRDPEPNNDDYALVRSIRGDCFTQFLRDTRALTSAAGKTLSLHIENRMLAPPDADCYTQIHWDWRTWLKEKLADEVDLKYIGPCHPACAEILSLARPRGIKVNWISADLDPRSKPRSIGEAPLLVDRAAEAGLNAINLYELWCYRAMTKAGFPLSRGSAEALIHELRKRIDEWNRR